MPSVKKFSTAWYYIFAVKARFYELILQHNFDDENWRIVKTYRTIFKELRTKS